MDYFDKLRQLVVEEKDLNKSFNYFFDLMDQNKINIDDHPPIDQKDNKEFSAILQAIERGVSDKLGIKAKIVSPMFFAVPEHGFFHGTCLLAKSFVSLPVLYFSSAQTGIFAISDHEKSEMFRFILAKISDMDKRH